MELKLSERPYIPLLSKTGVDILENILMDPNIHEIYSIGNIMARAEKTTPHDLSHAIRTLLICTKLIELVRKTKLKRELYTILDEKSMNLAMLIAAFVHDIGNYFNREYHSIIASIAVYNLLGKYLENVKNGYLIRSVICHAVSEHSPRKCLPTTVPSSIVALSDKLDVSKKRIAGYEPHSFMEYVTDDVLDISLRRKGELIYIDIVIEHPSAFYRVEKLQRFLNLYDLINRHFEIVVEIKKH
ncbi:MAG: HD domain-containing protein [Candidatus Odinarchaeia archaeon]